MPENAGMMSNHHHVISKNSIFLDPPQHGEMRFLWFAVEEPDINLSVGLVEKYKTVKFVLILQGTNWSQEAHFSLKTFPSVFCCVLGQRASHPALLGSRWPICCRFYEIHFLSFQLRFINFNNPPWLASRVTPKTRSFAKYYNLNYSIVNLSINYNFPL